MTFADDFVQPYDGATRAPRLGDQPHSRNRSRHHGTGGTSILLCPHLGGSTHRIRPVRLATSTDWIDRAHRSVERKALAFGARACLIGRPWVYAVAARGEEGVNHILRIVREEMLVALALTGVNDVEDLDRSVLIER